MTADITYGVLVEYTQQGSLSMPAGLDQGIKAAKEFQKTYSNLGNTIGGGMSRGLDVMAGIGDRLVSGLETVGVAAGAAFIGAVGVALKEGLAFDAYKEGAINSLASIDSMMSADSSFDEGVRNAEGTFERLRISAKKLPGELKDAMGFMTAIAPVTQGFDRERVENLSSNGVAAAMALGVSQQVAARELAKMISGHATGAMPLFAKMGLGSAKDFNQLSETARFEKIEEKFNRLGPAIEAYSHSMAGLKSSAADTMKNVAGLFAAPLYAATKNSLENGLAWFGRNESAVNAFAERLGKGVVWVFEAAKSYLTTWAPIAISFGTELYNGVKRAADYLGRHLGDLTHAAGTIAGVGLGAKLAKPAIGIGVEALGAVGVGGASATMIGGVAAAAALVNLGAAMSVLTDRTSIFHDAAVSAWSSIGDHVESISGHLLSIWSTIGPTVMGAVMGAVNAFGTFALGLLDTTLAAVDGLVSLWDSMFSRMGDRLKGFAKLTGLDLLLPDVGGNPNSKRHEIPDLTIFREMRDDLDPAKKAKPEVTNHTTTNHNNFTVNVDGAGDPHRIAVNVVDIIKRQRDSYGSNPSAQYSR